MQYNVLEARNQFSKLIEAAEAGEEVVIARRGKPVLKFVLVADDAPLGSAARIKSWLEANPLPIEDGRSSDEIDAYLAEERDSWD